MERLKRDVLAILAFLLSLFQQGQIR